MKKTITSSALLFFSLLLIAQPENRHSFGIATGPVYLSDDKHVDPAVHLEYAYHFLWGARKWQVGPGVEMIMGEERHIGLALSLGREFASGVELGFGPGIMFEGSEHFFCLHIAGGYGIDLKSFSLGPVMELAHTGKHYHIMAGLQLSVDF